ncbi:type IV secretory system conjugative DNA transfer family protein [Phenylobacterium koreense]|uniref:Type IV secretion system protein VirD4 n=1 Tax=Phenylobacterium koreense TaxID=266125 RepID=A0ABV2ENC5_9CAUL
MGVRMRLFGALLGVAVGLQGATQYAAWSVGFDPALGKGLRLSTQLTVYEPWRVLAWRVQFGQSQPRLFARAGFVIVLGVGGGLGLAMLGEGVAGRRGRSWGDLAEARSAGLCDKSGCVLGELDGRLLITADLRPTLVTGGTRSGKGRGHVTPSLLSWPASALVHDPKSELWRTTAGWRSSFSHVLYFNPRDLASARWNPLAEISPGPGEIAQIQRLVAILADPGGVRDEDAIWDKSATEILEAVVLHVLYAEPDNQKTLLRVRELLADLDAVAETMLRTLHRAGSDGRPQVHPFIQTAAKGYVAMHDRFRTSVQGTARAYLKWLAGEDMERALSASDFSIGDLMCAEAPMSLYVQAAPSDVAALRPLIRMLFYAAAQSLTAHETQDVSGRPKRHELLLAMDEFPLLGRLPFFEKTLRLMSGYGLKAMLVAQSLNDIVETYGPHSSILDNCFVYTAFSALDPLTQDKVSRLTGLTTQLRTSRSGPAGLGAGRASISRSETERPLMDPGEIRGLSDDQQLMFVAGRRPLLARKLRYDQRAPFSRRAARPAPDQAAGLDTPGAVPHPWVGRRALGEVEGASPVVPRANAEAGENRPAAHPAEIYRGAAGETAAQEAFLDHLQGRHHD